MFTWLSGSDDKPPAFLKFRSSKTFIIVVVASAVFTDIFAYGIVVPVFPFALTERAAIAEEDVQLWVSIFLAVYGAALLVASPICGWLADRMHSRQLSFLLGLIALGGSTALLCAGSSIAMFTAGRVLQGVSAAVVWVTGLALLVDTVGPDEIGVAMGYVGLSMSLAILLSPLLGGIVFEEAGYYSVYAMAFGLIVLDLVLRFAMIERKVAKNWLPELEIVGSSGKSEFDQAEPGKDPESGRASPLDVLENNEKLSPTKTLETNVDKRPAVSRQPSNAAEAAVPDHAPSLVKRVVGRLPPVVFLFGSRRILAALWACMIQATLLTSFDSTLPLFVRDTFGWDSIGAGLIFLPVILPSFSGPVIGTLSDKYGPRWLATAGFVLSCPVLILLRLVHENNLNQKVMLCAFLAILGVGLTLALTPVMAEISYAVADKAKRRPPGFFGKNGAYAQAYGLFNMAWAAGSMIGPLLGGLVNRSEGWGTATLILGCVSIFTALPTAIWTGGSFIKLRKARQERSQAGVDSAVNAETCEPRA
ncbi:Putative major facilitator superfamily, MFS transporter superfamily [Septoria linicola]|uniref:Major facilitator superfamily, MFS transporter superfamily n=1 Tax=Septoria linicola TaxID=215465 RepID=A0A9Q9AXF4_9PEZI|nr:putative major facilitator superfamily, MFS transporter superfamily [Septoria linicola]USW53586.1 Putative major facilitator superfamily, MFS transporter superfamily [Septoria linicola]